MNFLFRHLYHRSVKSLWNICCIGLCMIPVIIGIFIYFFNIRSFHLQTVQNNEAMLVQIHDLTEEAFKDIQNLAYTVATDDLLNAYQSAYGTKEESYAKMKTIAWLNEKRSSSPYVKEIDVYFPKQDSFITDMTTAALDIAYYSTYANSFEKADDLRQLLLDADNREAFLLRDDTGKTSLVLVRKTGRMSDSPILLFHFDNTIMDNMRKNVEDYTLCELNFFLKKRGTFLYAEKDDFASLVKSGTYGSASEVYRQRKGRLGTFSYIDSQLFDITFILHTPYSLTGYEITKVNIVFLAGLFVLLLGGSLFTSAFIKANYQPIKELMDLASDIGYLPGKEPSIENANEYAILKNAFQSLQGNSESMQNMLNVQEEKLKHSLCFLLLNNSAAVQKKTEYMSLLQKYFPCPYVSVGLLTADPNRVPAGYPATQEELERLFSAFQREEKEKEGDCGGHVYSVKRENLLILLFNLLDCPKENADRWDWKVTDAFARRLSGVEENERVFYSNSSVHSSVEAITRAYQEAEYVLRYRLIFGSFPLHTTDPSTAFPVTQGFCYSAEQEERLKNAVTSGKGELALAIFEEIWVANTQKNQIVPEYLFILLFNICGMLIQIGDMVQQKKGITEKIYECCKRILDEREVGKIKGEVELLIREISDACLKEHEASSEILREKIYTYIEANYGDPNLSVEAISDAFGKSRTNLFLLFKDQTGNSLLYHINSTRIEHAKKLLMETQKTVQEIAEETGFSSLATFSRVFKKYTALSPGKYREVYTQKEEK